MIRLFQFALIFLYTYNLHAHDASVYLGSRESDPASIVENISTIYEDYSEIAVDMVVAAPDPLVISRFYSSRDTEAVANLEGWRFLPHAFLTIEGTPEEYESDKEEGSRRLLLRVGDRDGTILTYVGWKDYRFSDEQTRFIPDVRKEMVGLSNNARGNLLAWADLRNNSATYDSMLDQIEITLCTLGKRFYERAPEGENYRITHEILPSGNKIFYEFDGEGRATGLQETNASEKKTLARIDISYEKGIRG